MLDNLKNQYKVIMFHIYDHLQLYFYLYELVYQPDKAVRVKDKVVLCCSGITDEGVHSLYLSTKRN